MDNYLEGMLEGRRDSTGSFTLDLAAALAMMRRFRLPSAQHSLLACVQAAVGSGAESIGIIQAPSTCLVAFAGIGPTPHELAGLFGQNLGGRWLDLAVGVNSALACGPVSVTMERGQAVATWTPQEFEVRGEWPADQPAERVSLSLAARICNPALLTEACRYAPVPITLNGQLVNQPAFPPPGQPGKAVVELRVVGAGLAVDPECRAPIWDCRGGSAPDALRDWPGEVEVILCQAAMGIFSELESQARLNFVYRGVSLGWRREDCNIPGLVAVVCAEGLQRDLSGLSLVADHAYEALVAEVFQQARHMRMALHKRHPNLLIAEQVKAALWGY